MSIVHQTIKLLVLHLKNKQTPVFVIPGSTSMANRSVDLTEYTVVTTGVVRCVFLWGPGNQPAKTYTYPVPL